MSELTKVKGQKDNSDELMVLKNNILTETVFFEVKKYLYPIVKKKYVLFAALGLIVLGLIFVFTKLFVGMTLLIFGALVFVEYLTMENKAARNAFVQVRDAIGQDYCTYTYTMTNTHLKVRCMETNMSENMPLTDFVRTAETEHTFVLFNKESLMVIIRTDKQGEEKMAKFKALLEEKCPNLNKEVETAK